MGEVGGVHLVTVATPATLSGDQDVRAMEVLTVISDESGFLRVQEFVLVVAAKAKLVI